MTREAYFYSVVSGTLISTKLYKDGMGFHVAYHETWEDSERLVEFLNAIGLKLGHKTLLNLFEENFKVKLNEFPLKERQ